MKTKLLQIGIFSSILCLVSCFNDFITFPPPRRSPPTHNPNYTRPLDIRYAINHTSSQTTTTTTSQPPVILEIVRSSPMVNVSRPRERLLRLEARDREEVEVIRLEPGSTSSRERSPSSSSGERYNSAQQLQSNKESTERLQAVILGGKPGVDYPNFTRPPKTKFNCRKMQYGGMFADVESKCQSYHVCYNRRMDTFMCPTGTLFNQAIMACDFWYNVNCDAAPDFYDMNFELYHTYQTPKSRPAPPQAPRRRSDVPLPPAGPPPPPRPAQTSPAVSLTTPPVVIFRSPPSPPPTERTTTRRPVIVSSTPRSFRNSPTPPSTTTATSTSLSTPRTRKATTPRFRVESAPTRTRPPRRPMPPGMEVDDRDWVFAWLKSENGTRADKMLLPDYDGASSASSTNNSPATEKRMPPENYPLFNYPGLDSDKHKTDTAFSFAHELNHPIDYGFSVNHNKPVSSEPKDAKVLKGALYHDDFKSQFIARTGTEMRQESAIHPNPWLFPIEPEEFRFK